MRIHKFFPLLLLICFSPSKTWADEIATAVTPLAAAQSVSGSTLVISGTKNSQLQYTNVSGPDSSNYTNGFTRRETTDLKITGQLYDQIKVLGSIQQSDDLLENKYSLELATRHLDLLLGDFQANVPDSDFSLENQAQSGARFTGEYEKFGWVSFATAPKGNGRFDRFYGNATQGPYKLNFAPVVPGSEQIFVDKVLQTKGVDYDIDFLGGQITFKKQPIAANSLVEVVYTSRDSLYDRYLYGLELHAKPIEGLRWGAYYVTAADDKDTAASIYASQTASQVSGTGSVVELPTDLQIIGTTANLQGRQGKLDLEYDFSTLDQNEFTGDYLFGQAGKIQGALDLGPFRMNGKFRRTTADYNMLGSGDVGQNLRDYGVGLDFKPNAPFYARGDYENSQQVLTSGPISTQTTSGRAAYTPKDWFSAIYQVNHDHEETGTTVTAGPATTKDSLRSLGELAKDFTHTRLSAQLEVDRESGMSPQPLSATSNSLDSRSDIVGFGASLKNFSWISGDLSALLRDTDQSDSQIPQNIGSSTTQTYQAKINSNVDNFFLFSSQDRYVEDSLLGENSTLDNTIRIKPLSWSDLQGNYKLDNLQMLVLSSNVPIATNTLSGKVELTPYRSLDVICSDSWRSTEIKSSGTVTNSQGNKLGTAKWAALSWVSLEAGYTEDQFDLLNTSDPNFGLQSSQMNQSENFGAHFAPSVTLGVDVGYTRGWTSKSNLSPTSGVLDNADALTQKANLGMHSAMSQRLRYTGSYMVESLNQAGTSLDSLVHTPGAIGSVDQQANQLNLQNFYGDAQTSSQTVIQGLEYEISKIFVAGISGSYAGYLSRGGEVTTSGGGLNLKIMTAPMTLDAAYNIAASSGASSTLQQSVTGNLSGKPLVFLTYNLKLEYTRTDAPYSKATQVNMNVSEKF